MLARNDQHVARFESLIQHLTGDRQILEPKPQEYCAFGGVNAKGITRQFGLKPVDRNLRSGLIEGPYELIRDLQNRPITDHVGSQSGAKASRGQI